LPQTLRTPRPPRVPIRRRLPARARLTRWAVAGLSALGVGLVTIGPSAHADLQSSINAKRAALDDLQSAIARDTAEIHSGSAGLLRAEHTLSVTRGALAARESQLDAVEGQLITARNHLTAVENRLASASSALDGNLVATYEGDTPDVLSVVVDAHGFTDLLNRIDFLHITAQHDADIVGDARAARLAVTKEADSLGALEQRDQQLAAAVTAQNNQATALETALFDQHEAILTARADKAGQAHGIGAELAVLQKREASIVGEAAPGLGDIQIDTGGMVQPPPGAPAAVAQVIAAGNAIATLPYVYGGGHASFHADAYDCSGSVSYALAAAGLVSAPMTSGQFESWGDPGPGKWITVWANAGHVFMYVAGWRFDTVALAEGGTRWSSSPTGTAGFVERHPPGL
jgi:peptidoglycan hydrolase CwlO-like protein